MKIYPENELIKGAKAKVYIDGKEAGRIGGDMFSAEIESGEHEVLITSEKIEDIEFKFEVGEYEEYGKRVEGKPAKRVIKIITDPPGAKVYVDGEYVGDTPKFVKVEVGKGVDIKIEKEGYKAIEKKMRIPEKGPVVVKEYRMEKIGILSVKTEPEGAEVYVDGKFVGKSPVEVELDRSGEVRVSVQKKGYEKERKNVQIQLGKVKELLIKLKPAVPEIIWQRALGGSYRDCANSIIETKDGGYLVVGWTDSNNGDVSGWHGDWDMWVVKLDENGNIIWQKALGGSYRDEAYSVIETKDGGYLVVGYTFSNGGDVSGWHEGYDEDGDPYPDMWVVKLGW